METETIKGYRTLLFLSTIATTLSGSQAIIAYDCGEAYLNVTTISLLRSGECDLNVETPVTTSTYIQLLQLSNYAQTHVVQCKIEILRTIYHCGMHSHISAVHNGYANYLQETSRSRCIQMHKEGLLKVETAEIIDGLKSNHTYYRSIAGKVNVDGTCKGIQYSDYYGTWDDVIVQATVKISLRDSYVPVRLNAGKVILKSGTVCNLT